MRLAVGAAAGSGQTRGRIFSRRRRCQRACAGRAPRGRLAAPGTQIVRDVVRASRSTGGAGTVQPLARALAARNHSSVRLPFAARPNYALQQTGPDGIRLSTQHQVLHNQDPELSHPDRPAAERGRYAAPIPPV
jgi:hypothetical protein